MHGCSVMQVYNCTSGISPIQAQSASIASQQVTRKVFEVYMTTDAANTDNACTIGLTNAVVSASCMHLFMYTHKAVFNDA